MLRLMCLLLPPVIGTALVERFLNRDFSVKSMIYAYAWECLCVNLAVFYVFRFAFPTYGVMLTTESDLPVGTATLYIVLAAAAAFITAYLTAFAVNNTKLSIESKKTDDKTNKKGNVNKIIRK